MNKLAAYLALGLAVVGCTGVENSEVESHGDSTAAFRNVCSDLSQIASAYQNWADKFNSCPKNPNPNLILEKAAVLVVSLENMLRTHKQESQKRAMEDGVALDADFFQQLELNNKKIAADLKVANLKLRVVVDADEEARGGSTRVFASATKSRQDKEEQIRTVLNKVQPLKPTVIARQSESSNISSSRIQ